MPPRVLIADKIDPVALDILRQAGLEIDERPGLKGDELRAALRQADGAVIRSKPDIFAAELENPGKLRAIVRAGVGVDNIDVPAATRKGVVVMNTPGGNTVSAAEHTIALMLALSRHIPAADAGMKAGKWDRNKYMGAQVAGKTLGVAGLGRIGLEVARRAAGLDMKILGYDPLLSAERAAQLGVETVGTIDELVPRCDYLTVHAALTDQTRGMIGAAQFDKARKGLRVLNVARGGIIDEAALAEALRSGKVAGAGIDVFTQEPPPADNPLLSAPNIVLTPHLGASTVEAQEAVSREAAELMAKYLLTGVAGAAVNLPFNKAELEEKKLYVDLAYRLGLLQAQMAQGTIQQAALTCKGEAVARSARLLSAAFTAGLLNAGLEESVHVMNAEMLARERGLEVVTSSTPMAGDFGAMLVTDVTTAKKTYTAAGVLFGNEYLRLVQLGSFRLDAYLDGVLLVFTHRDVPGLVGHIGTIFGKHNVNIAQMAVGRAQPGGEAIAVLNIDSAPVAEALAEVRAHPAISSLSVCKLPAAGELPVWLR